MHFKTVLSEKYSELVYYGLWYSPLREALDSFFQKHQCRVSGTVRIKLAKGSAQIVGRKSPYSLYHEKLATYSDADQFDHDASKGFITLWGLPYTTVSRQVKKRKK
jgi:argininosuccinate synthase